MFNLSDGQLLFRKSGEELHQDVREAMEAVAKEILRSLELESLDLSLVTTKTYLSAAFPKFVLCHILGQKKIFDEAYVEKVWQLYQTRSQDVTSEQFSAITLSETSAEFGYKKTYAVQLKRGWGLLLIALHCRGAITLPMSFNWPQRLVRAGIGAEGLGLFSELLGFLRLLDADSDELPHPAFKSVGMTKKRREWFLCYGTKLLLATGWQRPQDASLEDLLRIKDAESQLGVAGEVLAYKALIDVLRERYKANFAIRVDDWVMGLAIRETSGHREMLTTLEEAWEQSGLSSNLEIVEADLVREIVKAGPILCSPKALRNRPRLPGLSSDLMTFANQWLDLQDAYKRTVKRESYKPVDAALGYLNIYLFFYLTYWFQHRPTTKLTFPNVPIKLVGSIFISRLMEPSDVEVPLTLVQYLDMVAVERKWGNNTHYGVLKQIEGFFNFLEHHSDDLPGCKGFRQPIPDYAYPQTTASRGTDKRPIPRRLFGVFLDYIEALRAHLEVIQERALTGELDCSELERCMERTSTSIIDTFATSHLVGFVPMIFTRDRAIPLQCIPNCLGLRWFPVVGGRSHKLPQPHALNQILVALYTGLRHNHIQWLGADTFDSLVAEEDSDFTLLHVNTDKSMRKPWSPHVNFRVIEILRNQLAWRRLIDLPGFQERRYYNDNPNTKWPPILSLFAADERGRPHHDNRYTGVWQDLISALDGLLLSLGEKGLKRLSVLEPPHVMMHDPSAPSKRKAYGATCKSVCELIVKSRITPHSARVTVVSQYTTLLPAEVIGERITGQKRATVSYYTVIDPEDLREAQVHQAMQLREQASRSKSGTWGIVHPEENQYIRADDSKSNFSQSLRKNLNETLVSYGCVSITMNEESQSGLDVLRETNAVSASENKTEICPYGNHCPPEVLKQWRGMHRCGLCQYAVRSVDHLPAVSAKVKEFDERLHDLTMKVEQALDANEARYTDEELDQLDDERSRLAEELMGWRLNEEVLDAARIRIAKGQDDRRWIVQKPEIILQDLQRIPAPSNLTAYLLMRLGECIAYPSSESPQIRARFDILRRKVLARSGQMERAFDPVVPSDPARECAGLLRTIVEANNLTYDDVTRMLEGNGHLEGLLSASSHFLLEGDAS